MIPTRPSRTNPGHTQSSCRQAQRVGAPLRAPFDGYRRARRGEYRVRYRIDEEKRQIVVMDIDHRRDACHA